MTESMIQDLAVFIAGKILKQPNRAITANEPLISSGLIDSFSLMESHHVVMTSHHLKRYLMADQL